MNGPRKEPKPARGGFTLIELMIVVIIVGLLAAIALPKFRTAANEAYRATMVADMRNLAAKQELFHNINLRYGTLVELNDYLASNGVTVDQPYVANTGFAATATHAALPGYVCGYFMGDAPPGSAAPATAPSQVVCQ